MNSEMALGMSERVKPIHAKVAAMVRDEIMPLDEEFHEVHETDDALEPSSDVEDRAVVDVWLDDVFPTYRGDANLDGQFDTSDLILVLQSGGYEDGVSGNATWATGDWTSDLEFDDAGFPGR